MKRLLFIGIMFFSLNLYSESMLDYITKIKIKSDVFDSVNWEAGIIPEEEIFQQNEFLELYGDVLDSEKISLIDITLEEMNVSYKEFDTLIYIETVINDIKAYKEKSIERILNLGEENCFTIDKKLLLSILLNENNKLKLIKFINKTNIPENFILLRLLTSGISDIYSNYTQEIIAIKEKINQMYNYIDWGNEFLDFNPKSLYFIDESYAKLLSMLEDKKIPLSSLDRAMVLLVKKKLLTLDLLPIELLSIYQKEIPDYQNTLFRNYKQKLFIEIFDSLSEFENLLNIIENIEYYDDISKKTNYTEIISSDFDKKDDTYQYEYQKSSSSVRNENINFWKNHKDWLLALDWSLHIVQNKEELAGKYGFGSKKIDLMEGLLNKANLSVIHIDYFLQFEVIKRLIMIEDNVYYKKYNFNSFDDFIKSIETIKEELLKEILHNNLILGRKYFEESELVKSTIENHVEYFLYPLINDLYRIFDYNIDERKMIMVKVYDFLLGAIEYKYGIKNLAAEVVKKTENAIQDVENTIVTFDSISGSTGSSMACGDSSESSGASNDPDCRETSYVNLCDKQKDRVNKNARLFFNTIKKGDIGVVDSDDRETAALQGFYNHSFLINMDLETSKDYYFQIGKDKISTSSTIADGADAGDTRFGSIVKYRTEDLDDDEVNDISQAGYGSFEPYQGKYHQGKSSYVGGIEGALMEHRELHQTFRFKKTERNTGKYYYFYTNNDPYGELYLFGSPKNGGSKPSQNKIDDVIFQAKSKVGYDYPYPELHELACASDLNPFDDDDVDTSELVYGTCFLEGAVGGAVGGCVGGATLGAAIGSIFGPLGSIIGGAIGCVAGAVGGSILGAIVTVFFCEVILQATELNKEMECGQYSRNKYYCSSLAWQVWDDHGYDLDNRFLSYVTPDDIKNSKNFSDKRKFDYSDAISLSQGICPFDVVDFAIHLWGAQIACNYRGTAEYYRLTTENDNCHDYLDAYNKCEADLHAHEDDNCVKESEVETGTRSYKDNSYISIDIEGFYKLYGMKKEYKVNGKPRKIDWDKELLYTCFKDMNALIGNGIPSYQTYNNKSYPGLNIDTDTNPYCSTIENDSTIFYTEYNLPPINLLDDCNYVLYKSNDCEDSDFLSEHYYGFTVATIDNDIPKKICNFCLDNKSKIMKECSWMTEDYKNCYHNSCDGYKNYVIDNSCFEENNFNELCIENRIKLESNDCTSEIPANKFLGCNEDSIINNLTGVSNVPLQFFINNVKNYHDLNCMNFSLVNPRSSECNDIENYINKGCRDYLSNVYNCSDPDTAILYEYYCNNDNPPDDDIVYDEGASYCPTIWLDRLKSDCYSRYIELNYQEVNPAPIFNTVDTNNFQIKNDLTITGD